MVVAPEGLGVAWTDLPTGDRAANLEKAITCHQEALRFLTAEAGLVVGAEVAAMEEAAEVIAQAQAEEASAVLAMAAARAEAAEAVAESQRIQSAAAAAAVRALITAGLVEEAAAHEAVTALTAAGRWVWRRLRDLCRRDSSRRARGRAPRR